MTPSPKYQSVREAIEGEISSCRKLEIEADSRLRDFDIDDYFSGETRSQWVKQKWSARLYRKLILEPQLHLPLRDIV